MKGRIILTIILLILAIASCFFLAKQCNSNLSVNDYNAEDIFVGDNVALNEERKCIRCESSMVEGLRAEYYNSIGYIRINRTKSVGQVKCAVCPECGYIEYFLGSEGRQNVNDLVD